MVNWKESMLNSRMCGLWMRPGTWGINVVRWNVGVERAEACIWTED